MTGLDHILIGAPNLDQAVEAVERQTGVRAVYGGSHPGIGTRNALIALGNGAYLEIIAPDTAQKEPSEFARFVAGLKEMTPLGWAYHTDDLGRLRSALRSRGVHVERIEPGSRKRPDGQTLHWRTFEIGSEKDVTPFFIEWGRGSPHPSASAAKGCRLSRFTFNGPLPANAARALKIVGQSAIRQSKAAAGLHVALRCRRGAIQF